MEETKIKEAHNRCVEILNESDLTEHELVATLAQLLMYSGAAISEKDIDIQTIDLEDLHKEYYANNKNNDLGLGLILNGASIMGAIPSNIKGDVTANKEIHNDNSLSTTTKIPQENSTTSS